MLMGGDPKKTAIIILGGGCPTPGIGIPEEMKDESSDEEEESFYGVEASMKKVMKAFKEEDVKKAIEAMKEFMELCSTYEHYKMDENSEEY